MVRTAAASALLGLVLLASPVGAASLKEGVEALTAGRYEAARAILEPLAQAGDPEAEYQLGILADLGGGKPADPAAAFRWYRAAAEAGLPSAEFNVAAMLDGGRGVARDTAKAAVWYAKAAARGHDRAAYDLGQLYAAGEGVPRNPDVAAAWYKTAAPLPAAARKLAELSALPPARPTAGATDIALVPPSGISPADRATQTEAAQPGTIELVWTAPRQPLRVRFFVEVLALDTPLPRRVFSGMVDQSAVVATVDAPGSYAWRVYATSAAAGRYAASGWTRFEISRRSPQNG